LPRAEQEGWLLFLEHDPETVAVRLQRTEKGLAIKEKVTF
ncbi:MAG: MBL fold metallo-hydrolase, partial [Bacteroidetes bacterium]|nr:MBL fold metallo-hydrolase [Bacteroidota bacterium]